MKTAPALICFAVKEEAAPFRNQAATRTGATIVITGMGRENARKSVQEHLANAAPDFVLTCGFAGGLNPALALGDVLFETADKDLCARLFAAGAQPAVFFCAERIAATAAEKKRLRDETGADAVEMESAAIAAVCRERGIPCATVRVISDAAREDLPLDFNQLTKSDLSMDYGKLAWTLARSPGKIGALLRLQKQIKSAAEELAETLASVIWPA